MNMRTVAVASLIILAGCGGGSTATPPQGPVQTPTPTSPPSATGTATVTITVPRSGSSARRAPRASTASSLVVTVKSIDGQPPTAAQVPGPNPQTIPLSTAPGGNCTTSPSGETCNVAIAAPPGQVTYQFDVLDANSNKLATATVTITVTPGTSPHFTVPLLGIVASVVVTAPTLNAGTSFSGAITVAAFDAGGTQIVGSAPYANPFTLTDNDATGATSLTANGTTGLVVTANTPNDVVSLNYTGTADDSFTITASIPGKSPQTVATVQTTNQPVTLAGTTNDTLKPSDPNYNQATLFFTTIPSTKQFSASQAGWGFPGRPFVVTLDPATCGSGASAVVTVVPASSAMFDVTSKNAGICKGTVTGGPPGVPMTATIWFSVSPSNLIVN